MTQYIALIRGINVGGKNTVSMTDLKESLLKNGFQNVSSYINSGNIIFESQETDLTKLVTTFENILLVEFTVTTRVAVLSVNEIHESWQHAPKWWGKDPNSKHNAIFVIAPADAREVAAGAGDAKPEYEKIEVYNHVIFWSAPLDTFSRTRWSKIVNTSEYDKITIRNFNTTKKLVDLTT
jgi:uncharacterized protein (DUF1697 family)